MCPDDHDLDDEIRPHLEISAKAHVARGEDPEAARLSAIREPRDLLVRVVRDGAVIVAMGIATGAASGYLFANLAGSFIANVRLPGLMPLAIAAAVLGGAGLLASLMPAARASRVHILEALRIE